MLFGFASFAFGMTRPADVALYYDYADMLLRDNRILDCCAFFQSQPAERKFKAMVFVLVRLMERCEDLQQARQISYLIDEHDDVFSATWRRKLLRNEIKMYAEFGDMRTADKIATCLRKEIALSKGTGTRPMPKGS